MRRLTLPLLLLLAASLSACEGSVEEPGLAVQNETIPVVDADRVKEAEESILTACDLQPPTQEGSDIPVSVAVETLADLYREYPEGAYNSGNTDETKSMRTVIEDNARRLRDCGKASQATRLTGVL